MSEIKAETQTDLNKGARQHINSNVTDVQDTPVVDMYCTISRPDFGSRYHWTLTTKRLGSDKLQEWDIFQAIQKKEDGPYESDRYNGHPRHGLKKAKLVFLGQMPVRHWDHFIRVLPKVEIPAEAGTWTSQDYVILLWGLLQEEGLIDDATWDKGYEQLLPHYGEDYEGNPDDDSSEDEDY